MVKQVNTYVYSIEDRYLKLVSTYLGHRPVNAKRAVFGSKGVWKLSTLFLSCLVNNKTRKYIVFNRQVYLCCTFRTNISLLLLTKFTGVA